MLTGCSTVIAPMTSRVTEGLTSAVLDHNDPETVREGAPAYLLMVDAMIAGDPDNTGLLIAGAQLYSSYTSGFVSELERGFAAGRARSEAMVGAVSVKSNPSHANRGISPSANSRRIIDGVELRHVPALFAAGVSWATWVEVNRADWIAVADKARVEAMMLRVTALNENYRDGAAHLSRRSQQHHPGCPRRQTGAGSKRLRTIHRAVPGQGPHDQGSARQRVRSNGLRSELHDRLLHEVIEADPNVPGLVLLNSMAQAQARILLAESNAYFEE